MSAVIELSAERIAGAAREVAPLLLERLAVQADALASGLEDALQLVAWDREQLIGQVQMRLTAQLRQRVRVDAPGRVRIVERRMQPLEAIDAVWSWLRRGSSVRLEFEHGTCEPAIRLMRGIAKVLPEGALEVATAADELEPMLPRVGVDAPGPRVALIEDDADRELAAYVLARTSLRRSGAGPHAVKTAYVIGPTDMLQRHLVRLWVGVEIGSPSKASSFAGPIGAELLDRFLSACEQWRAHAVVEEWCAGAILDRAGDDPSCYAAPALFATRWPAPVLPLVGPMLLVVECDADQARTAYDAAMQARGQAIQIGGRPGLYAGDTKHIRGALLVERLPPGLPDPRPV